MKKFLILERGSFSGFISTNLKHSVWGVNFKTKQSELLQSLREDFGNIQVSFPNSPDDDLNNEEMIAYYKLQIKLNEAMRSHSRQLKIQFGEKNARI